jgi:thiosulfate dehydrogenase
MGLTLLLGLALLVTSAQAKEGGDSTRGAMLFDNWFAVLGVDAPDGDMPLWTSQSANTRSGPDTWRCVTCHGWDYQGKDGAYRSGSNFTGFPGVLGAAELGEAEITAALQGQANPQHDFSAFLDETDLADLATFMKTGLVDDSQYIDSRTYKVIGGDLAAGRQLYDAQCAECHGADGTKLKFRFEGLDATLGTLASIDPWRFLHKTRFGTPGTDMVIGATLGWTAEEGRNVLLYAQSLPSGLEAQDIQPPMAGREGESGEVDGGPASGPLTGIATAFGAMATSLGFAVLLGAFLIGVIFLVVWLIRDRKNK